MTDKKRKVLKVNIGCGPIGKSDWVNIDYGLLAFFHRYSLMPLIKRIVFLLSFLNKKWHEKLHHYTKVKWPKGLIFHNCLKGLPFENGEVDHIFASHFLEHVKYYQALPFLKEAYRALKKGGLIRIAVPDLAKLIEKYNRNDQKFFKEHTYIGWDKDYSLGKTFLRGNAFVSFFFPYHTKVKKGFLWEKLSELFVRPHLWMYDFDSLADLLYKAGFRKIERKKFQEGEVPDLKFLDAHPQESLYVEAKK